MITEDFCSYEVAKLLKEKGFNKFSYYGWDEQLFDKEHPRNFSIGIDDKKQWISCHTHQMAMKWLREVHNICITIYPNKENGYEAVLYNIKDDVEIILQSFGIYGSHIFEDSYEEAVEAACIYALKNLI